MLYVDNRRLAEGSLSRHGLRAYRVAPDVRQRTRKCEQSDRSRTGDRSRIEGGRHLAGGPV